MDSLSYPRKSRAGSAAESERSIKDNKSVKSPNKDDKKQIKDGKGVNGRAGWIGKMAGWLQTSEPSVYALIEHQKEAFQKAGVSQKDTTEVHDRLNAPIGEVPEDAISPIGGLAPEEILRKKTEESRRRKSSQVGAADSIAGRLSSGSFLIYTRKGSVSSAASPFDHWSPNW